MSDENRSDIFTVLIPFDLKTPPSCCHRSLVSAESFRILSWYVWLFSLRRSGSDQAVDIQPTGLVCPAEQSSGPPGYHGYNTLTAESASIIFLMCKSDSSLSIATQNAVGLSCSRVWQSRYSSRLHSHVHLAEFPHITTLVSRKARRSWCRSGLNERLVRTCDLLQAGPSLTEPLAQTPWCHSFIHSFIFRGFKPMFCVSVVSAALWLCWPVDTRLSQLLMSALHGFIIYTLLLWCVLVAAGLNPP